MTQFAGQTVIITGAGQGIGYGLCAAFAAHGATVALNDIDADLAQAASTQINDEIGVQRVHAYGGDAADVNFVRFMVNRVAEQYGTPTVVIANAGITKYIEFLQCTPETFDSVLGVNLRGSYFLAQAAALKMIEADIQGRILLMSSVVGSRAFLNFSVYSTTKAAIRMMAKSIALELGAYGITCNSISPGATLTERTQREDPHYADNWAEVTVSGRVGLVEDIVNAALFLASPASGQITGQDLLIDGGWSLRSPLPSAHPEKPVDEA